MTAQAWARLGVERSPPPRGAALTEDGKRKRSRRLVLLMAIAALIATALMIAAPHSADGGSETAAPKAPYASLQKCNLGEIMLDPNVQERRWKEFMRVSKGTFKQLCDRLARTGPYILRYDRRTGKPLDRRGVRGKKLKSTLQEEVAIGLFTISSLESYTRIGEI
mmetsp:Transcript_34075/g.84979  ORF Transcript_34075/g.84979 Transcript_34075/m.84979 type:complete len:165 (+) Transcript_34075:35-529(+)